jgi:hypothetical protein
MITTLPEAIRTIVSEYKRLLLAANGSNTDPAAISISRAKPDTKAPRDFGSEAREVEELVIRVAKLILIRMDALKFTPGITEPRWTDPKDRHHPVLKEVKRIILKEGEGIPAVELAFMYGVTESHVEKTRRAAGRDAQTGVRKTEMPLTEPAVETLKRSVDV